ncbi:hypothetical protein F0L68_15520 [Solihabitans fulvus]|uniref:Sugar lactone lactonase YvrE n=2 Tax=Solihabitans fulvus TaxID=1892852 RepID=A0A5B2XEZ2_9PSEU|nr:hypothetical protein F0L68_15520 [Solihabitans fulvus]
MITAAAGATAVLLAVAAPAQAATAPVRDPRILAHLDLAAGQQPENITLEPDGDADVTFAWTGQVARVTRAGRTEVIAQVPVPDNGDVPLVHRKIFLGGIAATRDGVRYVSVSTGTAEGTGIYRFRPGHAPTRVAALPADSFVNGLAIDQRTRQLYVADSANGVVWRVPLLGGAPVLWADGAELKSPGSFGANGVKLHDGAVWVSNTGNQTLVRIPVTEMGAAGTPRVAAEKLGPIDDFAFVGDRVLAAINADNRVVLIDEAGSAKTVLTAQDGLSNPTSIALRGDTLYVANAAYFTAKDPNLLTAHLAR